MTAAYAEKWRQTSRQAVVLVLLTLTSTAGATRTVRAASYDFIAPDGTYWEPLIEDPASVRAPGGFGSTDLALCTMRLVLLNRQIASQASGQTLATLLTTHLWIGASVQVWLWEARITDSSEWASRPQMFSGEVIGVEQETGRLILSCRQSANWNRPISPRSVTLQEFPRAPEEAVGLPMPLAYGSLAEHGMRKPWLSAFPTNASYFHILRGRPRASGAILVDTGRGGASKSKVVVAGHAISSVVDETVGTAVWMDGQYVAQLKASGGDIFNAASGAGILLGDNYDFAYMGVPPSEVINATNSARDPRSVLDAGDVGIAWLDYTNLYRELSLAFPAVERPGEMVGWRAMIGYQSSSNLSGLGVFQTVMDGSYPTPPSGALFTGSYLPPSTSPTIALGLTFTSHVSDSGGGQVDQWAFDQRRIRIYWQGGAPAGTCRIFFFGYIVQFKPRRDVVKSDRVVGTKEVPIPDSRARRWFGNLHGPFRVPNRTPAVTELRGKFYANWRGQVDDVSGTYTGVAFNPIEKAPDIVRHLLQVHGGVGSAQIHSSFAAARALLVNENQQASTHALSITESVDVLTAIQWLASESLSLVAISPHDDTFRFKPWRTGVAPDYGFKFKVEPHITDPPTVELSPLSDIVTGVRVAYDYDARSRSHKSETAVSADRSVAGYEFRNLRDEYLAVVPGVNWRFDWKNHVGTTKLTTFSTGSYTVDTWLQELDTRLNATESLWVVANGAHVVAGVNDKMRVVVGVDTRNVVLTPGFMTMEQRAADVQNLMNLPSGIGMYCSYSRVTNKFTFSQGGGQAFTLFSVGSDDAMAVFGFDVGTVSVTAGQTVSSDIAVEEGLPVLARGVAWQALFLTGANGSEGTNQNCAELMGFPTTADELVTSAPFILTGYTLKGSREKTLATAGSRYGKRREVAVSTRTIFNTRTARSLRNRIADLFSAPRAVVKFTTDYAPDLERGDVIEFDDSMDDLLVFPEPDSDGSFANKAFVVVELEQSLGPTSFSTRVTAVHA